MEAKKRFRHARNLSSQLHRLIGQSKGSSKSIKKFITPNKPLNIQKPVYTLHRRRKSENCPQQTFSNVRIYQRIKHNSGKSDKSIARSHVSAKTFKTQKMNFGKLSQKKEKTVSKMFKERYRLADAVKTKPLDLKLKNTGSFFHKIKVTPKHRARHTKVKSFALQKSGYKDPLNEIEKLDFKEKENLFPRAVQRSDSKSNHSQISDRLILNQNLRFYDQKRKQFKRTRKRNLSIPAANTSPFSVRLRKVDSNAKILTNRTRENSPNFVNNQAKTPKGFRNFSKLPSGTKSKQSTSNIGSNNGDSVLYEYPDDPNEFESSDEEIDFDSMGNYFTNYEKGPNLADKPPVLPKKRKISPLMRAILINWMGEVAEHFFMKRLTLHMAVVYLDRYLFAMNVDVTKQTFQLLGITCLYLASKFEETNVQKIEDFLALAKNIYNREQLLKLEKQICVKIQFKLWPKTLDFYLIEFTNKWDVFLKACTEDRFKDKSRLFFRLPLKEQKNFNLKPNQLPSLIVQFVNSSYTAFCYASQLIDCLILDPEYLCYKPRLLTLSVIYTVLSFLVEDYTVEEIVEIFSESSQYLSPWNSELNIVFRKFLESLDFESIDLEDLLPEVQFLAKYFAIKINLDSPKVLKKSKNPILKQSYNEFLAFYKLNNDSLSRYKNLRKGQNSVNWLNKFLFAWKY